MWEIGTVETVEVSVEDILWYLKITLQTMLYTFCRCVELQSHWFSDASNKKIIKCIGRSLRLVISAKFSAKSQVQKLKTENDELRQLTTDEDKTILLWKAGPENRTNIRHGPTWSNSYLGMCLFHFFSFIFSIILYNIYIIFIHLYLLTLKK